MYNFDDIILLYHKNVRAKRGLKARNLGTDEMEILSPVCLPVQHS